jgi:hypothetical protein
LGVQLSLKVGESTLREKRLGRVSSKAAILVLIAALLTVWSTSDVVAYGNALCGTGVPRTQAGEVAHTGSYLVGSRSTVEGQRLDLCTGGSNEVSGSFHWAALENLMPPWDQSGYNIVQVGYGRCVHVNNGIPGLGTLCNGSYYWYWAWGSYCGGTADGSGGVYGPIPIRIGAALTNPPASADYYVLRQTLNGLVYYSGYVNGQLLTGQDANGNTVTARIRAYRACWDSDNTYRRLAWFGEVFNGGDSMGGWNTNGTKNHLDYTSMRYSVNTGWLAPSLVPGGCNVTSTPFTCTIAATDHIYIDSNR